MKWIFAIVLWSFFGCDAKQNSSIHSIEQAEVTLKDRLIKSQSSLAEALFQEKNRNKEVFSEEVQEGIEKMIQSFDQLSDSVIEDGKSFPLEMITSNGNVSNNTSVIYIIRGIWCPYSRLVLEDIKRYAEDYKKLQIPIIVLSTESQETLDQFSKNLSLSFDLVSDKNGRIAQACGLSLKVDGAVFEGYQEQFHLKAKEILSSQHLPMRSTFIVDSNGVIINRYLNPDHRTSPEGIDVLKSAAAHKYHVIKPAAENYRPLTQFEKWVIEEKGTERAYSGEYWDHKGKGVYVCRKCNNPLYVSGDKFDSHCGWPSFDDEISKSVIRKLDADGYRTEILCANCNGHLGHVFEGERFTDKNIRHCVNSVSVKFVPYQTKQ